MLDHELMAQPLEFIDGLSQFNQGRFQVGATLGQRAEQVVAGVQDGRKIVLLAHSQSSADKRGRLVEPAKRNGSTGSDQACLRLIHRQTVAVQDADGCTGTAQALLRTAQPVQNGRAFYIGERDPHGVAFGLKDRARLGQRRQCLVVSLEAGASGGFVEQGFRDLETGAVVAKQIAAPGASSPPHRQSGEVGANSCR